MCVVHSRIHKLNRERARKHINIAGGSCAGCGELGLACIALGLLRFFLACIFFLFVCVSSIIPRHRIDQSYSASIHQRCCLPSELHVASWNVFLQLKVIITCCCLSFRPPGGWNSYPCLVVFEPVLFLPSCMPQVATGCSIRHKLRYLSDSSCLALSFVNSIKACLHR